MKKLSLILMVLFCLLLMAYKMFFYLDRQSERAAVVHNKALTRLSEGEIAKMREGDFILRRGFGFFSDYISTKLNDGAVDVTHAGILVKDNRQWFVIHSLSSDVSDVDGVQIQPLEDFLQYSAPGKIIVTRAKGTNADFGKQVAAFAKDYLQKHVPFDHDGRYDDDTELFCTELIWLILEKDLNHFKLPAGKEERKIFFYSMQPMYSNDYFEFIINQYIELK